MSGHIDTEMLRSVIREVLHELVGEAGARRGTPPDPARVEEVRIDTDADLAAFVRRLAGLCADAGTREALSSGKHAFRLHRGAASVARGPSAPVPASTTGSVHRVDREVLSEAKVVSLAKVNRRIVLGPRAVVTPLARDKARQLGLELERER